MKNHFDEAAALLVLIRHADSAAALRTLFDKFGSAKALFSAGKHEWRAAGISEKACAQMQMPDLARLDAGLEWCDHPNHHVIPWHSPDYPALLRQADNPPPALFLMGDIDLLWHPQIAVVGSRHPGAGGKENARSFARTFAQAGWCVTSGLAEGIDTCAHNGALEVLSRGKANTIAVVATGLDQAYPEKNRDLMHSIAEAGLVVSEHPPGTPPLREHFPSRNRIIAGLSLGCLVVEAAERSGALITARLAGEIGREVFAIPGSIHNAMARGCHKLIRQGALLVERPDEVVDALQSVALDLAESLRGRLCRIESDSCNVPKRPPQGPLWEALGHDPVSLDQLHQRTGLTTPELSSMLLAMELEGFIGVADGRYTRNT